MPDDGDPYEQYFRPRGERRGPHSADADPTIQDRYPPELDAHNRAGRQRRGRPDRREGERGGRDSQRRRSLPESMRVRFPSRQVRRRRAMLLTSGFMSVVILIASGCAWGFTDLLVGKIKKVNLKLGGHSGPQGAMNILLAGSDRRQGIPSSELRKLHLGHAQGARSDTMMLVHISDNHNRVTVVSLPRDSLVSIPGHGRNKLNAAFSYGGPSLAIKTVEQNTGVQIDHYVEVNFLGVVKIVNALGGVNVCLPNAVNDPYSGLRLPAGRSKLNGMEALGFVRIRHGIGDGSDLGRVQRQQQFMADLLAQATSTGTLTHWGKFSKFLSATLQALRTDQGLSASAMRSLANQMRTISPNSVTFTTVPLGNMNYIAPGVGSSVLWDHTKATQLFDKIKDDRPILKPAKKKAAHHGSGSALTVPPGRIALSVYNGAGRGGLGSKARADLQRVGFQVPGIAQNWPSTGITHTVIEYGPSRSDSAKTVAAAIPGSHLLRKSGLAGIKVILGSSYTGTKSVHVSSTSGGQSSSAGGAKTATQDKCK